MPDRSLAEFFGESASLYILLRSGGGALGMPFFSPVPVGDSTFSNELETVLPALERLGI